MIVKELIEKLQKYGGDRQVRVYIIHKEYDLPISDVTTIDEGSGIVWIDVDKPR